MSSSPAGAAGGRKTPDLLRTPRVESDRFTPLWGVLVSLVPERRKPSAGVTARRTPHEEVLGHTVGVVTVGDVPAFDGEWTLVHGSFEDRR